MTDTDNKSEIINVTPDGKVTKRILREGVGTFPAKNASVSGKTYNFSLLDKSLIKHNLFL